MYKSFLLLFTSFIYSQTLAADILLFEDFEDPFISYTTNIIEASDDELNYFGRIAPNGLKNSEFVLFSNQQGSGYFAAMDTDALPAGALKAELSFKIEIGGFENLQFSGLFAEDDANDGKEDWDGSTSFLARYKIDDGDFQNLLAFESSDGTNSEPAQDTSIDGIGDGLKLTDVFTQYQADINQIGKQLTLELILNDFEAGDEDIAFDNITITGDSIAAPVPIPAAYWLFFSALVGLSRVRRTM